MQLTSQEWKNAQRQTLVPESFIEIRIKIGNPDAQSDAVASTNGAEFFSEPQEIVSQIASHIKYAMLEPGHWILDGKHRIVGGSIEPPPNQYVGYIPMFETEPYKTADGEDFEVLYVV